MKFAALLMVIWLIPGWEAFAQDSRTECLELVSTAENEFGAGRFYGIPHILKDCLDKNSFSNEQLVRVYLLLTQVYLLIDDPIGAEDSYLRLLKADPEYIATSDKDPIDVVFLSQKFTTTPIFTPHFKAGLMESRATIIRDRNLFGNGANLTRTLTNKLGWMLGAGIEWNITDNWGIGGELLFSYQQFGINYEGGFLHDQLSTTERQYWMDVPLYGRYTDSKGRIRPYAYVGHTLNFLINSSLQANYIDFTPSSNPNEGQIQVPVEGNDLPITFNRKLLNRSLTVGGGVKIKRGKDFFTFDLRYNAGLTNISKGSFYNSGKAEDTGLFEGITRYGSLSNDLRVNNVMLTVGYVRPLYDPRKVKKARTKSLSKKMRKQDVTEDN